MLKKLGILGIFAGALALAAPAHAAFITGTVSFVGTACPVAFTGTCAAGTWSGATSVFFDSNTPNASVSVAPAPSLSYAGTAGTPVTFQSFTFSPALTPDPVAPLWTFTFGGNTYSFDLYSAALTTPVSANGFTLAGTGVAHITGPGGASDTLSDWSLSTNEVGGSFSFTENDVATGLPVPEPGSMVMLGSGLMAAAEVVRRRRKARA